MRKFIITAELRDITDKWDNQQTRPENSISYSRMVEILNEKALQYAKDYAKELECSKWISVGERLPENSGKYLVNSDNELYNVCSAYFEKHRTGNKFNVASGKVTHWQPLPTPPQKQ
jgi:hypothetical protein